MKKIALVIALCVGLLSRAQYIQVDSNAYSPQELIENILINSDCISNVTVTNVVGGDFSNTDQSYGYFNSAGSTFPFLEGLVLSTGRLQNVPGPNTSLSDDDAPNWTGDNDLELILNESNTLNATLIEFEFTTLADQINFNYLFASEEYQENNANTCQYSDLFGFLIRPVGSTQYTNIALVPNTQTPVKVTTVHSGIPGACEPQNEAYFGSWNNSNAPINFNGQTAVLTATANVVSNQAYHVKLVIADEQNYRYDSAVFLEAGSLLAGKNLGPNRLLSTNNHLCEGETLLLDATMPGNNTYAWYKDDVLLPGETNATYLITEPGTYQVEITFPNNCLAYGTLTAEYASTPEVYNTQITACDINTDGFSTFNLFDAEEAVTNDNYDLFITDFYTSQAEALAGQNPIPNPETYQNTAVSQVVYAQVESIFGCTAIAEVTLTVSTESLNIPVYYACYNSSETTTEVLLESLTESFETQLPANGQVFYYLTEEEAFTNTNALQSPVTINTSQTQTLFVKVTTSAGCFALSTVEIEPVVSPELFEDETRLYCLNTFPETLILEAGTLTNDPAYTYEWFLNETSLNITTPDIEINEPGIYTVNVSNPQGCSTTRTLTVNPSESALDGTATVTGTTVTLSVTGTGIYEYNINHGMYQSDNIFENVPLGSHIAYVRDINGCGVIEIPFNVFGFPKYFTPNGDGYHDLWMPVGLEDHQILTLRIFDRYGKLLKEFNTLASGWNGTFNGKVLPTDDYWYLATDTDGKEYRGHFTLVR
ncbi:MAG TPA: choice-of-anchor L domain-containing protein [Flavobacteriaceae bacterium]|nr:choice-of-anchor L domain-containing protein [Flavobacteriaceae bacterium]